MSSYPLGTRVCIGGGRRPDEEQTVPDQDHSSSCYTQPYMQLTWWQMAGHVVADGRWSQADSSVFGFKFTFRFVFHNFILR